MKPSFQVDAFESTRSDPPNNEHIPAQAFGANSETENSLKKGMFVRSVCLGPSQQFERLQELDVDAAAAAAAAAADDDDDDDDDDDAPILLTSGIGQKTCLYLPCGYVLRIHTQPRPKILLQVPSLLPCEAIRQLDPSVLHKVINLLPRERVLFFRIRHLVCRLNFNIKVLS
jgi:hypothetical protein